MRRQAAIVKCSGQVYFAFMNQIANNLQAVDARLAKAARLASRKPETARLIAVSKTHPKEAVEAALEAGQRVFGENRVQEAAGKFPALREKWPEIELHLIGPLQTNKVADAVALFDVIQTLDRPKLAEALAKEIQKQGRAPGLYLEVNIGREPQKAGLLPEETGEFLTFCRSLSLQISGLMCLPPQEDNPAPHFKNLAAMAASLHLPHLSMGMSADFETAIAYGATEVRVGTAIFGERK